MALYPEEQEAIEREQAKRLAHRDRLLALRGDAAERRTLGEHWRPLLRTGPLPEPSYPLPYEAPDLIP